jgi:hypothetical protein
VEALLPKKARVLSTSANNSVLYPFSSAAELLQLGKDRHQAVTFDVVALNYPDVLARIELLLHRLAIDVRGVAMERPKQSRRITLTIEIELDLEETERIKAHTF